MILLERPKHRIHCTATPFKRPVTARTKANSTFMVEFSIAEGKEMLIVTTYLLPLIAMASMLRTKSCVSHIRNQLTLIQTNTTNMPKL
jgi:hypothetical protein